MNWSFFKMLAGFSGAALTMMASASMATSAPQLSPFSAEYVLSKDGKVIGTSVFTLDALDDGVWRYASVTQGTAGLAKLLGAEVEESSLFRLRAGHAELLRSEYRLDATLHTQSRQTRVDWDASTVSVTDSRKGTHSYPTRPGLLDRHLLPLALGRHLDVAGQFGLQVATHDNTEVQHYRVAETERIEVPAGTFVALRVRRVDPGKHLSAWYAPGRFPVPVKLVQDGGDHLTLELKSFSG